MTGRVAGCGVRVAGYGVRVAGCGVRGFRFGISDWGYGIVLIENLGLEEQKAEDRGLDFRKQILPAGSGANRTLL